MKPLVQSHCQTSSGSTRFWLWVDGVGGFLVCVGADCTIGQPVGPGVDIGILADISSRHAVIRRQQDDYVLEPLRPAAIDGRSVAGPALLADRATIQLGESVRLAFRRPHPYSNSACLSLASQHRTSPVCDGVLLAGDSLVLGPGQRAHVACPAGSAEIVLYRQQDRWFCRAGGPLEINGRAAVGGGPLERSSRVICPDYSFTLEEAG